MKNDLVKSLKSRRVAQFCSKNYSFTSIDVVLVTTNIRFIVLCDGAVQTVCIVSPLCSSSAGSVPGLPMHMTLEYSAFDAK